MKSKIIMLALALVIIILSGCESQSGQRIPQPIEMEKVVIIDSKIPRLVTFDGITQQVTDYKVKRLEKGVVAWIIVSGNNNYEQWDTLFHKFPK